MDWSKFERPSTTTSSMGRRPLLAPFEGDPALNVWPRREHACAGHSRCRPTVFTGCRLQFSWHATVRGWGKRDTDSRAELLRPSSRCTVSERSKRPTHRERRSRSLANGRKSTLARFRPFISVREPERPSPLCSELCSDRVDTRWLGRRGTELRSRDTGWKSRGLACFVRV
jgi:hypothetical protein